MEESAVAAPQVTWTYRKWKSGVLELWGKAGQAISFYSSNTFLFGGSTGTPYPYQFKTSPYVLCIMVSVLNSGGFFSYSYNSTSYFGGVGLIAGTVSVGTTGVAYADIYVKGNI